MELREQQDNDLCIWWGSCISGEGREAESVGGCGGHQVLKGRELMAGILAFPSVTWEASGQAGQRGVVVTPAFKDNSEGCIGRGR